MNPAVAVARVAASTLFTLLAACGGSGPVLKTAPAPRPKVEAAPAAAEPSAFEQRWASACDEHGTVGKCPAPFDRPAVFIEVAEGEHATPPFCGSLQVPDHAAVRDALTAKRKALKACFRGAAPGSYVELGPDGTVVADAKHTQEKRTDACVAKHVARVLAGVAGPKPERVIVLLGSSAKPSDQGLSKESIDAVVRARGSEVNDCYDAALAVWPGLKGRIATSCVIWFDGQIAVAHTGESTLDNPMLECCINTAIRGWTFPTPKDGSIALVTFPFTLGGK